MADDKDQRAPDDSKVSRFTAIMTPHSHQRLSDEEHLAALGYQTSFKREFGNLATISFAFSIMGVSATVASTFDTPMLLGGPAAVVWAWALGSVMCCALAASIAEIVSAYPTSGGLYSASAYLVPKSSRPAMGYLIGWLNLLGQIAGVASTEFSISRFIWAAVVISKDGDYEVTDAKLWGLYAALLVVHGLINCLPTGYLASITKSFVFINLGTVMAIVIALAIKGEKHSRGYVFGQLNNQSGWSSDAVSFLLGLLSVSWTMTDYDATAHISEEVKQAAIAAPVAICIAVVGTAAFGWFYNIVLVLYSGDIANLPGPSGLSVATILATQINKNGFYVLWTGIILTANFIVITALQANSRTFFAFSRDGGLPDRGLLGKLSPQKVPINAVIAVVVVSLVLALLQFASATALNAIFSLCAIALDCSYAVPIACKVIFSNHPEVQFKWVYSASNVDEDLLDRPGPFSLGSGWFGKIINSIAVLWVAFVTIIFVLPTVRPVTPDNMNYASVITIGVLFLSAIWFAVSARRYYTGPRNFTGGAYADATAAEQSSGSALSTDQDLKRGVGTEVHV